MNYQDSMAGLDQIFQALVQDQLTPTQVTVDEMDDTNSQEASMQMMLDQLMSGQNSASAARMNAMNLYNSVTKPKKPGKAPWDQ